MHIPVLQKEVLQHLNPGPNENFIDCTINGGGHSLAILEKNGPRGIILGIDQDKDLIKNLQGRVSGREYGKRLILACGNFANLKEVVKKEKFGRISGILFDLGMSSWHLDQSGRGFSFQREEPLDMRYSDKNSLTARKILNSWSEEEIERILREYGQERFSKKIAKAVVEARKRKPVQTTSGLVVIIKNALPVSGRGQRINLATRTFQALRIAVNEELQNLEKALPQAFEILKPGGRLVVISFHSLEDRIVKNFFKEKARAGTLLTKKPLSPSFSEFKANPRSRSAKLRAMIKK